MTKKAFSVGSVSVSGKTIGGAVLSMVVIGGSTVVYGAWSSSGSGPSQAQSISAQTVTLSAPAGAADLYPGSTGAVHFKVFNPNPYAVKITGATFGAVTSSDASACPASHITTTNQSNLELTLPANATSAPLSISGAVTLASAAPDGCQNRTFSVNTNVSGVQVVS